MLARTRPGSGARRSAMPQFAIELFDRAAQVPADPWHAVVGPDRPLQRLSYLRALEACARRAGGAVVYALLRSAGAPVAALTLQEITVGPGDVEAGAQRRSPARFGLRVLVCGNLVVTGAPAIVTAPSVAPAEAARLLVAAVEAVCAVRPRRIGAVIVKDVPAPIAANVPILARAGFRALAVEPAMELAIRPEWRSLDDYAGALRSKYRARFNRSRRRSAGLERRLLSSEEAAARGARIDQLYRSVYQRAGFAGPYLGGEYLVAMRRELGPGELDLIGYFDRDELVAVNSRLRAGGAVESYFFGLEHRRNDELALFQSLLYDDLAHAIEVGASSLHLGRTSYEPKAALGARPRSHACFYRPLGPLSAPLCWLLTSMYRIPTWRPRQPFREAAR